MDYKKLEMLHLVINNETPIKPPQACTLEDARKLGEYFHESYQHINPSLENLVILISTYLLPPSLLGNKTRQMIYNLFLTFELKPIVDTIRESWELTKKKTDLLELLDNYESSLNKWMEDTPANEHGQYEGIEDYVDMWIEDFMWHINPDKIEDLQEALGTNTNPTIDKHAILSLIENE